MCLALSVPWVLYHSFCRALNKQVPLLELQLSKLKIYALTVCILSMCSRLRLRAFSWYAEECVFVQNTSFTVPLSSHHRTGRSISTVAENKHNGRVQHTRGESSCDFIAFSRPCSSPGHDDRVGCRPASCSGTVHFSLILTAHAS